MRYCTASTLAFYLCIVTRLADFTDELEVYSIDEAFLSVQGMPNLRQHGLLIKDTCWKEQRMPVCVGIAATKTLAKLANHIAKQSVKLEGVCVIDDLAPWGKVFNRLAVNKVWGIGSRLALRLEAMGIHSVQDLRQADIRQLREHFGIVVERTVRELNGEPCIQLDTQPHVRKQIISSRSFGKKISNLNELQEAVANYTAKAALKLRRQHSQCQQLTVALETSRFIDKQFRFTRLQALTYPTNDSRVLIDAANRLCQQLYQSQKCYSKAGVCLMDISDTKHQQNDLFAAGQVLKSNDLMQAMDKINSRFGQGQVFVARQGTEQAWQMQRAFKSPCYTTRLGDVPIVKL